MASTKFQEDSSSSTTQMALRLFLDRLTNSMNTKLTNNQY